MDATGVERIVKDKIIPAINKAVEYGSARMVASEVAT
jgi:hypothetical protein